jgi:hypothetical protein
MNKEHRIMTRAVLSSVLVIGLLAAGQVSAEDQSPSDARSTRVQRSADLAEAEKIVRQIERQIRLATAKLMPAAMARQQERGRLEFMVTSITHELELARQMQGSEPTESASAEVTQLEAKRRVLESQCEQLRREHELSILQAAKAPVAVRHSANALQRVLEEFAPEKRPDANTTAAASPSIK